jgi:hypothetical protein
MPWADPEQAPFILTITRIPGRPIRTGTGRVSRCTRLPFLLISPLFSESGDTMIKKMFAVFGASLIAIRN